MKIRYSILLIFFIVFPALGADSVSIEEFKKMSPLEREQALQQAPPEQKEGLKAINLHLMLVADSGGEAGLKMKKERSISRVRGFLWMEGIFITQTQLWDQYAGGVYLANKKSGMSHEKQADVEKKLTDAQDALRARLPIVHALVFNMAPSPLALDLEKKVEKLNGELREKFDLGGWDGVHPQKPFVTKAQLDEADKQIDEIFEEMKKLPTLTPAQLQKEYDDFPEAKVRPWD